MYYLGTCEFEPLNQCIAVVNVCIKIRLHKFNKNHFSVNELFVWPSNNDAWRIESNWFEQKEKLHPNCGKSEEQATVYNKFRFNNQKNEFIVDLDLPVSFSMLQLKSSWNGAQVIHSINSPRICVYIWVFVELAVVCISMCDSFDIQKQMRDRKPIVNLLI